MANGDGGLGDFLHPKSMLTPGATGGATLMITNTLGNVFQLELGYVALVVSALFGILLWALTESAALWQRIAYFVLNTLIIFCVAMGSNTAGQKIADARSDVAFSIVSLSYAQEASPEVEQAGEVVSDVESIVTNPNLSAEEKLKQITEQVQTNYTSSGAPPPPATSAAGPPDSSSQGFFRQWNF